jgi:FMN phosphatase YigB (HAD superfamily)
MRTCWVNPEHLPPEADICPDHEIEALSQLEALLEEL